MPDSLRSAVVHSCRWGGACACRVEVGKYIGTYVGTPHACVGRSAANAARDAARSRHVWGNSTGSFLHSCTSHVTQRFPGCNEDVLAAARPPRCCLCPTGNKQSVGRSDPGEAGCTLHSADHTATAASGPSAALRRRCEERHSSRRADVSGRRDWEGGGLPLLGYHYCPAAMRGSRLRLLLLLLLFDLLIAPSSHAHSTLVECHVWGV